MINGVEPERLCCHNMTDDPHSSPRSAPPSITWNQVAVVTADSPARLIAHISTCALALVGGEHPAPSGKEWGEFPTKWKQLWFTEGAAEELNGGGGFQTGRLIRAEPEKGGKRNGLSRKRKRNPGWTKLTGSWKNTFPENCFKIFTYFSFLIYF